jgi:hypothetical protein
VELVAEVSTLWNTTRFAIGFVREDFYELFAGEEELAGDAASFSDLARERAAPSGARGVALWLPLPEGRSLEEVTLVRVGAEWKIDSFGVLDEEAASESAPSAGTGA